MLLEPIANAYLLYRSESTTLPWDLSDENFSQTYQHNNVYGRQVHFFFFAAEHAGDDACFLNKYRYVKEKGMLQMIAIDSITSLKSASLQKLS